MNTLNLALVLSLQDKLVKPLQTALTEVEKGVTEIEKELQAANTASEKVGRNMADMTGPQRATKEAAELARTTEKSIGLAERLNRVFSATGSIIKGITTAQAAIQAAKFVVAEPMQKARAYERQVAETAFTAFNDRSLPGLKAGREEINSTVISALRFGGGKRDESLAALNDMLGSGTMNFDQAKVALPIVQRYATAGNVSSGELAEIVVKALQNGFKESSIRTMLDQALAAGVAGGFELKDMAKWLPELLTMGKTTGLTGADGWVETLADLQVSVITAGSKDKAGNNLLNLYQKITSPDTANDAKKLGIDLAGTLVAARGKGMNSVDAFMGLVDKIANQDPRLVALQKQMNRSDNPAEKKAILESQFQILQGASIGKLIQDRQALLDIIGKLNNRAYKAEVISKIRSSEGMGEKAFANIADTNDFKVQQRENEQLFAQTNVVGPLNDAMGKLSVNTTQLYQQYPKLGEAIEGTKLGLQALTAMALAAGGAMLLQGGAGKLLGRLFGGAAAEGAAASAAGAAGAAAAPAGAATAAAAAGGAGMAATVGSVATGGLLASLAATNAVRDNPVLRQAVTQEADPNGMLGAMGGDFSFAAAIMNAAEGGKPGSPPPELAQAAQARNQAANDSQVDLKGLVEALRQPVDVRLKVDAPENLSIQQITEQVARAGRRGG